VSTASSAVTSSAATSMRAPSHSLERALHRHVDGRRERRVVRREQQLRESAAEGRPVDPFAWSGEQHLLDHLAEMIVRLRQRRAGSRTG